MTTSPPRRIALLEPRGSLALVMPVAIACVAMTLAAFARIIAGYLAIEYDLWFELGMVSGQVVFQWLVLWRASWNDRLYYAAVLLAVSTLGAALLWPLLAVHHVSPVSPLHAVVYFMAVVGIMFLVHVRLVTRAKLPTLLCATWVVYRLLILVVVVKRP